MAEPQKTNCPNCRQALEVPEEVAGRTVSCPFCKHQFTAPGAAGGAGAPGATAPPAWSGIGVVPPRPFSRELPQVTAKIVADLASTRPWVLFLSILGFIFSGLMLLAGVVMMALGAAASGGRTAVLGLIYVPLAVVYLFPSYFLLKYSGGIREFLTTRSAPEMEQAIQSQKSFWKFVGIFMIVVICLYILFIVIGVAVGMSGMAMMRSMR
jgi:hypothetical protein